MVADWVSPPIIVDRVSVQWWSRVMAISPKAMLSVLWCPGHAAVALPLLRSSPPPPPLCDSHHGAETEGYWLPRFSGLLASRFNKQDHMIWIRWSRFNLVCRIVHCMCSVCLVLPYLLLMINFEPGVLSAINLRMRVSCYASIMHVNRMAVSFAIVLLIMRLCMALQQLPRESIIFPQTVGSCGRFQVSQLGNFATSSQQGLVPQNLQYLARTDNTEGSIFFTLNYPFVRIINAVHTCESQALSRNKYSTVSVIVEYYCRGIACVQLPSDLQDILYTHLFSFACKIDNSEYATLNHFARRPFINRSTTNTAAANPRSTPAGLCMLCTVSPAVRDNPATGSRFNFTTGCLGNNEHVH